MTKGFAVALVASEEIEKKEYAINSYEIGSDSNTYTNHGGSHILNIKILSSNYNTPGSSNFDYPFESENGIRQQAVGSTKYIGDTEVVVTKGSYQYVGPDEQTYVVDCYADENGFHSSAPHLPQDVPISFSEITDAVDAQIAFAAANPNT
ncbi:larval cuticle protein 16/17-like [Lepeophtheirus salmonis]|uniref:larval cuticle protein 16/17-like n=1 Tax=Lepeophtheirus salmonis TaxID=72036 RepID=UPI001AE42250|nr:larval cuticle protein 16/17-like [Lepeophtheirus salmonis]